VGEDVTGHERPGFGEESYDPFQGSAGAGQHQHEPLGVADEAARLFAAFGERARSSGLGAHVAGHAATGAPDCTVCPMCQIIGALREARPEVVEHLSNALGSIVAAAKAALEANERQRAAARRPHANGFEHIDIG
jgi:hypothetical protein